ncbi:universal stress protein UspA [Pontibacillus chungwhensis BH030062]|uniref:Universal stress protein UspA n=2 Tax=Pontibacillus TaxID=289201 RepID=A0A0A2V1E8_9BACI|nr:MULTISPECIES: universal stress protein [Pontibacillus]KGP92641.1 universal stress protein UspA [Pontibacillus chungwhensis BH030062]GGD02164.1 universal stress protein UspA [Pontibacillus salipaludis]
MRKKILVAYDGSAMSKQALQEAKSQAADAPDAEIHVVSVVRTSGPFTNAQMSKSIGNELAEQYRTDMNRLKEEMKEEGVEVITDVIVGKVEKNAGARICDYAKERNMDLIIVGNRGFGNVKKMILGSVSNNIVQHATCPVLVMK